MIGTWLIKEIANKLDFEYELENRSLDNVKPTLKRRWNSVVDVQSKLSETALQNGMLRKFLSLFVYTWEALSDKRYEKYYIIGYSV